MRRLIRVIVTHEVEDVDHWLKAKGRREIAAKMGVTFRDFFDPLGSKRTGVICELESVDFLLRHINDAETLASMRCDGVRLETVKLLFSADTAPPPNG